MQGADGVIMYRIARAITSPQQHSKSFRSRRGVAPNPPGDQAQREQGLQGGQQGGKHAWNKGL
jgi:hypothetical protein